MDSKEERWRELCARAAVEQDSQKLMELIREISRLLAEKQKRGKTQIEDTAKGRF
jgi:hypothetical protein